MLPLQALTAKNPIKVDIAPIISRSSKLATYLGAFNNSNSHDDTVSFDIDFHQIIVDTGEPATFTPSRDDFISYIPFKGKVQGLGHMKIVGKITVRYTITDDNGAQSDSSAHKKWPNSQGTHLLEDTSQQQTML
eukprot:1477615-Ditylum_brightwellii.AAC.1